MSTRLDMRDASILPWAFPALDEPHPRVLPIVPEVVESLAVASGVDAQEQLIDELIAEQAARGHAEGFERGLAEGREAGYAAGVAAGEHAIQEQLADAARRIAGIVAGLSGPIPALERVVEEAVVALALEIARGVIGREVSCSREYLVGLIREAIAKVPIEMGAPQVALHPADLDLVRHLAPEIDETRAILVSDEAIEPGGCLVVATGEPATARDARWHKRAGEGTSQVDLTLAARWRGVMLTLFDAEGD